MKKIKILSLVAVSFLLYSCAPTASLTKEQAYASLYSERPLTIAIMPPINHTNNVDAKEYFYSTLTQPLCERGYYVIPPFLAMEMFKSESAYDSELFINNSTEQFGKVLGADVVLFTTITQWEKAALAAKVYVTVEYLMKSTKTNEIIFQRKGKIAYDTSVNSGGGGLLGALIDMAASAITAAATDHIKVARACNAYTLFDVPAGKYNPQYDTDQTLTAGPKEFTQTVR